jgi:hypothetical protein
MSVSTPSSLEGSPTAPAPDTSKKSTGWILVGTGGALVVAGTILDIVAATKGSQDIAGQGGSDNATTSNSKTNLYFAGTALLIAGAVTAIYGGSMVVGSKSKSADAPASRDLEAKNTDGVTKAVQLATQNAPTVLVPVVSGKF